MFSLKKIAALFAVLFLMFVAAGCEGDSAAGRAIKEREKGIERIREQQPVHPMDYSPTIETINRWADTWGQKGTVSYVYMQRSDGSYAGYYVIAGLPVSYCVGGSPPYAMEDLPGDETTTDKQVPAAGLDGAYYGGCNSSRYYGFDAVTGQYVEYTDGMVLTAVLSNQPLPMSNQPEPYVSSIDEVKNAN